ncbi:MAG: hypothetical protein JM58_08750 [Peptococcaceae bacterium BICA1-8]|nr:MAG: hypothetical protein JM58_08750 [Peptococcaceae bacterium BICA1-8]
MRINNNLMAMNTHRQLGMGQVAGAKSMEKLSSGLRINRAGDDAAGLSISEKMRSQIRGLSQASSNAQDGISLLQTAEGALGETHAILQRMRELAVQSATDTNTDDDRSKIQSEVNELAKEITRISNTTEFNTQNLLAGGLNNTFHVGANAGQNVALSISKMDASSLGVAGGITSTAYTAGANAGEFNVSTSAENLNGYYINTAKVAAVNSAVVNTGGGAAGAVDAASFTGSADTTFKVRATATNDVGAGVMEVTAAEYSIDGGNTWSNTAVTNGAGTSTVTIQGVTLTIADDAGNVDDTSTWTWTSDAQYMNVQIGTAANGGTVGSTVKMYNDQTSVTVGESATDRVATVALKTDFATTFADVAATGTTYAAGSSIAMVQTTLASTAAVVDADGNVTTDAVTQKGLNVSSQGTANNAITTINSALETVSSERSKLGAMQNRFEHTIKNLDTSAENLQASESRIRDVDMAKEMMNFTKTNILTQAAQAMLAQANQAPQGVLQLLR